jgi:hypothetical protein
LREWSPACNRESARTNYQQTGSPRNALISEGASDFRKTQIWVGGFMYLLFGPSMAALVVIAVIQLRDHFVASR